MNPEENYLHINRMAWNQKTDLHLSSDFYNLKAFLQGNSSLKGIELKLLGDIKGKRVLHLQCHFGMDSMSLSRMGAEVTGVDFSDVAIRSAKELAVQCQLYTRFCLLRCIQLAGSAA